MIIMTVLQTSEMQLTPMNPAFCSGSLAENKIQTLRNLFP